MRINHLHLRNFKGFEDSQFDFPRSADAPGSNGSFHLLIGRNATGKTSALDALAVAAGAWFLGVPEAVSRTIRGEDIRVKVSHGQRNMVAMIGDMAYRTAQLNPHLGAEVLAKTPGIVLIMDTPERESATADRLSAVFDVIDEGDYTKARARIRDIEDQVGLFPELQGAKSMLDRLEMLADDEEDR